MNLAAVLWVKIRAVWAYIITGPQDPPPPPPRGE
mgnify:CR=1 FL=1